MYNHGFIKVASATPKIKIANPSYNILEIEKIVREAEAKNTILISFPELSLTGYTCADLFLQNNLIVSSHDALNTLLEKTKNLPIIINIGMPITIGDKLYNCGVVIFKGDILGIVPKMFLPNYKEFYEQRWFTSGNEISNQINKVRFLNKEIPFGKLVFEVKDLDFKFALEICEDLWMPIPPSSYLAINGAEILFNLSASNELIAKSDYREQLVLQQSARAIAAYIYSSSGVFESTSDVVFGGDCLIAENGSLLNRSKRFQRENNIIYADIDLLNLKNDRLVNKSFADLYDDSISQFKVQTVSFDFKEINKLNNKKIVLDRTINPCPFIPINPETINKRCAEIFNIQVAGLAKRLEYTGIKNVIIGVSGGLDSTLALLVCHKTLELLNLPKENIIAITMPGFGTTNKTYDNAVSLMKALGCTIKEIDIKPSCLQQFKDIGQDENIHDIAYQNVQARARTQNLMNYANKHNGLVIGTGDLSEIALGWCTFNGDHMSMYNVNCSIPKTLVSFLVKWVANNSANEAKTALEGILSTPISPELLPVNPKEEISQITENDIGPYELNDFFLFHTLRHGSHPDKILFLANIAFNRKYNQEIIRKWLRKFYERFFSQQFKRNCVPDGPKVGSVSLSPRGDWRMPSDADVFEWIKTLKD